MYLFTILFIGRPQYHVTKDDQTTPTQKDIQSILDMGSEQQDDDEQEIETEKSEVQVMRSNSDDVTIENTTSGKLMCILDI